MKTSIRFLLVFFTVFSAIGAYGATMRCPNGIVSSGDTAQDVLDKCGPPLSVEKDSPNIDESGFIVRGAAFVEHWTYERSGGMSYQLRFIDDRLVDIRRSR